MQSTIIDRRISVGNILTIATLAVSLIVTITTYKATIDSHAERIIEIEQNQKVLESRIQLLESEMQAKQTKLDRLQEEVDRTVEYLRLILDKEGIKYVK